MRAAILGLVVALAGCGVSQAASFAADTGDQSATGTTLIVPVVSPTGDGPRVALWANVTGIGSASHPLYVPLALSVGTVLHTVRARVRDAGAAGKLVMALSSTADSDENFRYTAFTPPTGGTGLDETITLRPETTTEPAAQYFVALWNNSATTTAQSRVYRLELDVN